MRIRIEMGIGNSTAYTYEMKEIENHNTINDCWIVIQNNVYDVSKFHEHSRNVFIKNAGKNCTEDFKIVHFKINKEMKQLMNKYFIGYVV